MQDRNNIQNSKTQNADKDMKRKSNVDKKSPLPGQPDRDRQATTERQGRR